MARPEPTLPIHEPTLPIHEPLMNHPVPLDPGGIEPETFLGTALRQAYDYWQDQPGFANPCGDLGPRFGTRGLGVGLRSDVSEVRFLVSRRADVLETGNFGRQGGVVHNVRELLLQLQIVQNEAVAVVGYAEAVRGLAVGGSSEVGADPGGQPGARVGSLGQQRPPVFRSAELTGTHANDAWRQPAHCNQE